MSELEQREIEEEAKAHALQNEAARYFELKPTLRNIALQCSNESYIAGSAAMAEKKNLEVKVWKNTADEFKKYNDELKQQAVFADEIQNQLQTRIEQDIAQFEAAQVEIEELKKENTRLHKGTIHQHNKIEVIQAELSRVKAWIDKVLPDLERLTSNGMVTDMYPETVARLEQALTEYQTLNEPKR